MKKSTLKNYINETKRLYESEGINSIYQRIGWTIEHYRNNKGISDKDFYYLGLVDYSFMRFLINRKDILDVGKMIGSDIKIYDYCYNHLPINPIMLRENITSMYGDINEGRKLATDPNLYYKMYFN